jgi:DNA-binding NarL/FixJ family response regulator
MRERQGDEAPLAVIIQAAHGEAIAPIIAAAYGLSRREQQVVRLIARGVGTGEIAAQLFLSQHTVCDHVKAVVEKGRRLHAGQLVAKVLAEQHARPLQVGARHVGGEPDG